MTRRTELLALAERVESGETGYGIDKAVWDAMKARGVDLPQEVPRMCSTSIDAQAALPGRVVTVRLWVVSDKNGERDEWEARTVGMKPVRARAPTEASARLAALLRAMAEDGE